jgi:hypothetical protein
MIGGHTYFMQNITNTVNAIKLPIRVAFGNTAAPP